MIELERAKIEPAAKLFQQECDDHTDSQACKEQRDALVKALNGFVSMVRKELALLDANGGGVGTVSAEIPVGPAHSTTAFLLGNRKL
jgi:hypothetical protein